MGVGTGRRPASPAATRSRRSQSSFAASSSKRHVPPRALTPSGLVLFDKPAGPSSFAIVRDIRDRTGARAGHAGTLDPFATGLLLVLLGAFTKEAQRFVGLEKRYETAVDLSRTTSTGDPEGDVVDEHEPPPLLDLEAELDALRGEVELKIPAAS